MRPRILCGRGRRASEALTRDRLDAFTTDALRAHHPAYPTRRAHLRVSRRDARPEPAADAAELPRAGVLAGPRQRPGAACLLRRGVRGIAVRERVRTAYRAVSRRGGVSGAQAATRRQRSGARGVAAGHAIRALLLSRAGERLSVRGHRRRSSALGPVSRTRLAIPRCGCGAPTLPRARPRA